MNIDIIYGNIYASTPATREDAPQATVFAIRGAQLPLLPVAS